MRASITGATVTDAADATSLTDLIRNEEFLALASTAFARSQAYSTILIALAMYADLFGTSGTVEGLFGTVFALTQFLIVLPLGRVVDTGDSKRYLLAGLLLNVAIFTGFTFVSAVEHVIVLRALQGIGASLLWITGSTVVGEISPDGKRGLWLGSYNQVAAFSSLAGTIFGGLLLYTYGFQTTYAVLVAVTALATLSVYRFLRDNPGQQADTADASGLDTLRTLLQRPAIRALVSFRFGFSVAKMAVIIFLPIYAKTQFGINPLAIGGILAGGKLTKSLLQGRMGTLIDSAEHRYKFVFAGAAVYAVGIVFIPLAGSATQFLSPVSLSAAGTTMVLPPAFFGLFAAYGVLGIGDSIRLPASMTLFVEEGERLDAVAGSFSLRSLSWKVGQLIGPVAVGAIWEATSALAAFWVAAGCAGAAAVAFVAMAIRSTRREQRASTAVRSAD
ncbi:MFS transporter [Halomicroarcula sp. F27]|uniref:MFS transporter n=1 Tax=Haloarcula nitratireducens TaxID=2487749 RepID=A0AAW4P6X9_9EURY|nr:MFS transporter [Halomicroarcula nitratireducens]